jgi:aminopeptidase-like protein
VIQESLPTKKSRRGDAEIDKAAMHVLGHSCGAYNVIDFFPYGYDERQFCSPAFNLPVGCLMRTPHGCYPKYHTYTDNLDFVQPIYLAESLSKYLSVLNVIAERSGLAFDVIQNAAKVLLEHSLMRESLR